MKAPPSSSLWMGLGALGGLAYPFLVYFGLAGVPPAFFVILGLVLIAMRIIGLRRLRRGPGLAPAAMALSIGAWAAVAAGLALLLLAAPAAAVKAYPVAISLAMAAPFGLSLIFPPTVVERIARLTEPGLPPEGVAYTRRVTWVWLSFLLANAAIATATAFAPVAVWTLWNGLLSYLAMGVLFLGEWLIRQRVRRRAQAAKQGALP